MAYKCRAYPAPEQASALNRTFGCVRVVWNRTLAWRHQRYHGEQARTNFTQANAYLTAMKATEDLAWLNEVSSVPLQQAIRHQRVLRGGSGVRQVLPGAGVVPVLRAAGGEDQAALGGGQAGQQGAGLIPAQQVGVGVRDPRPVRAMAMRSAWMAIVSRMSARRGRDPARSSLARDSM